MENEISAIEIYGWELYLTTPRICQNSEASNAMVLVATSVFGRKKRSRLTDSVISARSDLVRLACRSSSNTGIHTANVTNTETSPLLHLIDGSAYIMFFKLVSVDKFISVGTAI